MKHRITAVKLLAGLLSALMLLAPISSFAEQEEPEEIVITDEVKSDPAFEDTASAAITPITSAVGDQQANLGDHLYIPYELPEYEGNPLESYEAEITQPFYFAPGEGIGTKAKDQGRWGTCWAFSVTGAAEASLIAQGRTYGKGHPATYATIDLSDLHTAYFFYHTETDPLNNMDKDRTIPIQMEGEKLIVWLNRGGNNMFTTFGLMAWKGMANEFDLPYEKAVNLHYKADQSLAHIEKAHCRNAFWINVNDKNTMKRMILKYGGVVVAYNHSPYFYDENNANYYAPRDYIIGGHSVMIVGWDDTYSRNNFLYKPNGDGAWIVKNSWGTDWGMKDANARGMYWMSYYDVTLAKNIGLVLDYEDSDNFDNNYQYDGTSSLSSLSIPASKVDATRIANQFEVKASDYERLEAVSLALESTGVHYRVQVYKKNNNSLLTEPDDGVPLLENTVGYVNDHTGYFTIPLEKPLVFRRGDVYSIVISIWHASGSASVFVDKTESENYWIGFINNVEYGQSWFAWGQKAAWAELSNYVYPQEQDYKSGYTMRIKGYTNNVAPVTYDLAGVASEDEYARLDHPYTATIVSEEELPAGLKIVMSGVELTEGESFTYDNATGEFTINNVNGPVTITAKHEHVLNAGFVTKEPTCGEPGTKSCVCRDCGEVVTVVIPATGLHKWNKGEVIAAPTRETTGVRKHICTVCGAEKEEEIPVLPDIVMIGKAGSYDVKVTGLDVTKTYTIRYATGDYSSMSGIKNGANAGFLQVTNTYETTISLPTEGLHTIAVQTGSEIVLLDKVTIETADIRDHLVSKIHELSLRVENLVGANYVKVFRDGTAVVTVTAKNFSTDGLKKWADMSVPEEGVYVVRVVYSDGGWVEGYVSLTAPAASVSTNGRVFTLADYGGANNVSYMRLAKGTYSNAGAIKAADDLRTYGAKYFRKDTSAFAALDAVNGETTTYTVQVGYASGYTEFITFGVTPTVPSVYSEKGVIVIENADGMDWIRCAPGVHHSLQDIRHADGSRVKKTVDIVNGTITFTGLKTGNYSLYYLYDGWNLSEGTMIIYVL
ncbi:MAG: hypothetical protein IJT91_01610 [Clostridia bacterium]|nr:hypothetical protein [Clostridia bacterium]